jgi:chromosomal replication initiation ATPase DnaA
MPSSQLVFDFEHRQALEAQDFLVTPCNQEAVAWIDEWPNWSSPAIVIHGPSGCGKSHLAQVFLARTSGVRISSLQLLEKEPPALIGEAGACLIDDMDAAFTPCNKVALEEALLHLYNTLKELGSTMMITAKSPPSRWGISLADLSSRLKTATLAEISPPDDALLAAVLVKQFSDRQLKIDSEVVAFVQTRIERSFRALGQFVATADRLALAQKSRISIPLMRLVLEKLDETNQ